MAMYAIASLTLIAGMLDDLRSRKVHNQLIMALFAFVVLGSLYFRGFEGSIPGVGGLLLALIITIPLFALNILGGGDVKLFAVFAIAVDPISMFWTLVYSIFWGALFGLTRAAISKELLAVVRVTYKAASRQKVEKQELHKMPYTFALLLGWFTQLTFLHVAGAI